MKRSKRTLNAPEGQRDDSPDSDELSITSPTRSPGLEPETRGRQGRNVQDEVNAQITSETK
jgi:hypothetical protein